MPGGDEGGGSTKETKRLRSEEETNRKQSYRQRIVFKKMIGHLLITNQIRLWSFQMECLA